MALLKPYDHGNYPQNGALGSSQALRTELDAIETGFDILDAALDEGLTGAAGSATIAAAQAAISTTQAGISTTQAGVATTKASEASTSASNANTSKIAAQSAQAAAEAARDSALSAYDNFDDRYLGPKLSDPTTDNDGDPLEAGALYFNTVSEKMRLYTGSIWVAAYVTGVASDIESIPSGNLSANNVQAALNELQSDIDNRATELTNHINDTADAHDASAISYAGGAGIPATDVEGALDQIANEKLDKSGGSLTGLLNVNDGADIASASTVDLTAATGNTVRITGTTAIAAFTMNAGQQMELVAVGALPLTYNATTMNINGGASYTCAAGDRLRVFKDGAGVVRVNVTKQDGTAVVGGGNTITQGNSSVTVTDAGTGKLERTLDGVIIGEETVASRKSTIDGGSTLYPEFKCRAWVNFNGIGTVAIRGSGNVTSITDNGTGDYTVNFTTAMPDANYGFSVSSSGNAAVSSMTQVVDYINIPTINTFRFKIANSNSGVTQDVNYISASFFR